MPFTATGVDTAMLDRIMRIDPDGWEHREPTDRDRAAFHRHVVRMYGLDVWLAYRQGGWGTIGRDIV
jgi:hypothetical protein